MEDKNYQFSNPFSQKIIEIWDIWKRYLLASHEFRYKSIFSEQAAIEQLYTLSNGEEEKADRIIKQSMRLEYKQFFPLRSTTTGNGKSNSKKQSGQPEQSITESFKVAFKRGNGIGEQEGNSGHSEAI